MTDRHVAGTRVLVVCDYFPPSTKAGGPTRSVSAIVNAESHSHAVCVITRDRDLHDKVRFSSERVEEYELPSSVQVERLPARIIILLRHFRRHSHSADLIYFNSVFSPLFTMVPMLSQRLRLVPCRPILLAPRGELAPGALAIKPLKKRAASWLVRRMLGGMPVIWHASSEREACDIRRFMHGSSPSIVVRPQSGPVPMRVSQPDSQLLTVAFVGRMVPIKNFEQVSLAARAVNVRLKIIIAGHLEDRQYWETCRADLAARANNVHVEVLGHLDNDGVQAVIRRADAMVLPTRGENFGHAIAEALAHGCPVMIPDTTMWTPLVDAGAGWIIDVDDPARLVGALRELSATPVEERARRRQMVLDIYSNWWVGQQQKASSLFDAALRTHQPSSRTC